MVDIPSLPQRKHLPHDAPSWVPDESTFFITVACNRRRANQLTSPDASKALLDSVRHYHDTGKWWCRLFLLMPDHLHALIVFPRETSMRQCVASWKSWHTRKTSITWQDGFFDHRIRNDAELQEKAAYIRNNPVRAGLVDQAEDWRHVFEGEG